ncbi:MAG: hypothetical protein ACT6Q8_12465 [Niveispirillum sp.]|uniref:hypothetical protein n=1 Tax=Niveispirillum sp. TaxID=1917217 RepID=UPI0040367A92
MTDPAHPHPDLADPRPRGAIGQWSDRVKALALLVLLACAGVLAGLGGGEGDRAREGLTASGPGLRTTLSEAPATLAALPDEQRRADLSGGDDPPPAKFVAASPPWMPVPVALDKSSLPPVIMGPAMARAGHAARMPTGPPAGLSA